MLRKPIVLLVLTSLALILLFLLFKGYLYNRSPVVARVVQDSLDPILIVHYHERSPYYITTPSGVGGLVAGRVDSVLAATGIPYKWVNTPPKRQLDLLSDSLHYHCLVGWFKTSEREKIGKFSLPVYQSLPYGIIARGDDSRFYQDMPVTPLLSNKTFNLLLKDGYSYGEHLDILIRDSGTRSVKTTSDNLAMLGMILNNHADYMLISPEEAEVIIPDTDIPKSDFQFLRLSGLPMQNPRYLFYNKSVPDSLVEKIDRAVVHHLNSMNRKN